MTFDPGAAAAPDSGIFGLTTSLDESRVVVVPVPFEATTSYGGGTSEGPRAVLEASRQVDLYDYSTGRPYEAARVRESLANLYETGKFEAIGASWVATGAGEADVIFRVRRARLITAWSFRGNAAVDGEALARAMDLAFGQPLDRGRFEPWARAIQERYVREGYPAVKVAFVVADDRPGRAELEIRIDEGSPVLIRESTGASRLRMLSKDPFMPTLQARLMCAQHNIHPNF